MAPRSNYGEAFQACSDEPQPRQTPGPETARTVSALNALSACGVIESYRFTSNEPDPVVHVTAPMVTALESILRNPKVIIRVQKVFLDSQLKKIRAQIIDLTRISEAGGNL